MAIHRAKVRLAHGGRPDKSPLRILARLALPYPGSETTPTDFRDGTKIVNASLGIVRIVDEHRSTTKVRARHKAVIPAIDRIVPVVSEHEEHSGRDYKRPPIMQ